MATEQRLIDANALLNTATFAVSDGDCKVCENEYRWAVMEAPTIEARPVVSGFWGEKILVGGFAEEWGYVCSECGCTVSDRSNLSFGRYAKDNQRLNYCPNCGADMRGADT